MLGEVLYTLTGQTDVTLLAALENQPTVEPGPSLRHFDPLYLHHALTAVRDGADVLCTSNTTDYTMASIGHVRIATPAALADDYGCVSYASIGARARLGGASTPASDSFMYRSSTRARRGTVPISMTFSHRTISHPAGRVGVVRTVSEGEFRARRTFARSSRRSHA